VIFDKASAMTMLYTNSKYDLSDDILEELGYSVEDEGGSSGSGGKSGGSSNSGGGTKPSTGSPSKGSTDPKRK
jgi:hypothetical protein